MNELHVTPEILECLRAGKITGTGAIILAYLKSQDDVSNITNRELAAVVDCSLTNISKLMGQLHHKGLVEVTQYNWRRRLRLLI